MRTLILAAGENKERDIPKCLLSKNGLIVLENIINISIENNINNINLVGGFEILKIMQKYQNLRYFYNHEWKNTKSLFSLSKAFDIFNDDLLISYADVIHKSKIIQEIDKDKINIFFDSSWKTRYENRDILNLEKIYLNNNLLGEFTGLLYIPKKEINNIKNSINIILINKKNATLSDLIDSFSHNIEINYIDVNGQWAELDSVQDIEHFKFGTKSETLNILEKKIKKSKILEQYTFTVNDYITDKNKILKSIQSNLDSELLVVRSSALNEDTENSSMAGNYESILKVLKDNNQILSNAIELVIESYTKNNQEQDNNNQILVQPYLENVTMSGVVFSKNLQTFSPYYTINYDRGTDTESVTSGNGKDLQTFICYNHYTNEIKDKNLAFLLEAIKEIESITKYDAIDVEFAFQEDILYILQVRPIAAQKDSIKVSNNDIATEIITMKSFLNIENNSLSLLGDKRAYGIMPDWNPAEIIGTNPRPLSFDLYKYIITDNIWAKSRNLLGYKNVENSVGIVSFSGKPYVDIQMSFNTFIPSSLDNNLSSKLIDYFILKLEKNPENHDKVEFDIAITAYDFNFDNKLKELSKIGFSKEELIKIQKAYKELTENIILEKDVSIKEELEKTIFLTLKREKIINSTMNDIDKIYHLLQDCKQYGTLPFAMLARFGFVGSIFLKSLLSEKIIHEEDYNNFFKSIHTIAKEFIDDFNLLILKKFSKNDFIKKYGHLRPGTYDITSKSYKEGFDDYIDFNSKKIKSGNDIEFKFSDRIKEKISEEISKHNLNFTTEQLISFIIRATEAREKAKFEFTKNLSLILELISNIDNYFNKDDFSYINLSTILNYKNSSTKMNLRKELMENIKNNRKRFLITSSIHLPDLIFNEKDIDMFYYSSLKPNFISHHKLNAEIVYLKDKNIISIENKIVLIENADPGFDWIFSHNIKGLITKYGGAASHMAIRCAEFDLPAAIGCGDKIFNDLLNYKKINLDCLNQKIEGLS